MQRPVLGSDFRGFAGPLPVVKHNGAASLLTIGEVAVLRNEQVCVRQFLQIGFGGTAILLAVIVAAAIS